MRHQIRPGSIGLLAVFASLAAFTAPAQTIVATAAGSVALEADPWPRQVALGAASVTLYPPQVESWDGNRIRFRAAVTLTPTGAGQDSAGVVWASAVTHVDRASRLVSLDDVTLSRATFPTLADGGDAHLKSLQTYFERAPQTIALDRLQSSLAAAPEFKPRAVAVQNVPPRVFVSDAPAILVPISGQPVLRAVPGTSFERVINTRMLILRDARGWYLRLYDGWMTADSIDGRWYPAEHVPSGVDRIAQTVVASGQADLLDGGAARPRPSLRNGAPSVYVSFTPAALIVFDGPPDLQPIAGTALMWAANTTAQVVVDIVSGTYYTLLAGRWFRSTTLNGPWTFVAARALPGDFSKIPPTEPAASVLASVAGTPQAKEALIESAIPQTATVPRTNGPVFAPEFDGHPQYRPIAGTPLHYVANSATPVIRVEPRSFLALQAGVWFEATSVIGPWQVAGSVPAVVYSIPANSPLHYVTYVRIYSTTPQVVEAGYTAGYTGALVTADGVVVHGTGYNYPPWIGERYFPAPATYGIAPPTTTRQPARATVATHAALAAQHGTSMLTGATRSTRVRVRILTKAMRAGPERVTRLPDWRAITTRTCRATSTGAPPAGGRSRPATAGRASVPRSPCGRATSSRRAWRVRTVSNVSANAVGRIATPRIDPVPAIASGTVSASVPAMSGSAACAVGAADRDRPHRRVRSRSRRRISPSPKQENEMRQGVGLSPCALVFVSGVLGPQP